MVKPVFPTTDLQEPFDLSHIGSARSRGTGSLTKRITIVLVAHQCRLMPHLPELLLGLPADIPQARIGELPVGRRQWRT